MCYYNVMHIVFIGFVYSTVGLRKPGQNLRNLEFSKQLIYSPKKYQRFKIILKVFSKSIELPVCLFIFNFFFEYENDSILSWWQDINIDHNYPTKNLLMMT